VVNGYSTLKKERYNVIAEIVKEERKKSRETL